MKKNIFITLVICCNPLSSLAIDECYIGEVFVPKTKLYDEASLKSKALTHVPKDTALAIVSNDDFFYRLVAGNFVGAYVARSDVAKGEECGSLSHTIQAGARVRSKPSTEGKILAKLVLGQSFAAKNIGGEWLQIQSGPHAGGYIAAKLVQVTELK
jgi:hypothetical protein